ncbi:lysylphosphatidylglycerol synthetase family protein [Pedobacter sp. N36a]|uniref:phosphatidylglycerol lysyltransferase domain-containing protein n=1 Tax=Pedobacter sp. N36a TaxID=2767996 RepID=UPI001656E2B2|nr:phosphatidylglycerol lysyltransferase domain-containing protein [Pedobacter sp. N36a]MBC8986808.1 lysylphosphatidylglycerol synthetase family protein [Pedobacter sp. N36a]
MRLAVKANDRTKLVSIRVKCLVVLWILPDMQISMDSISLGLFLPLIVLVLKGILFLPDLKNLPYMRLYLFPLKIIVILAMGILMTFFLYHEQQEIREAFTLISTLNLCIVIGISLTVVYIYLQGYLYVSSFRVLNARVDIFSATRLFLKRNLLSVFLPAGGFSSLVFFSKEISDHGMSKATINLASFVYAVTGIGSLLLLSFPVLFWYHLSGESSANMWINITGLSVLLLFLGLLAWSFSKRGVVYNCLYRFFPSVDGLVERMQEVRLTGFRWIQPLLIALLTEVVGIAHVYIAMLALDLSPDMGICICAYTIGTLFYCFSPLLKGLGTVEVSMVLVFMGAGFNEAQAISVTLLYRAFEFWLPLLAGMVSFFMKKNNILIRLLPAVFVFLLGMVNIISVFSPAITSRIKLIGQFIPFVGINFSSAMILSLGVLLGICSVFLIRGVKNAWYLVFGMVALSFIGNLTKGFDYEESLLALLVMVILLISYPHYYVKRHRSIRELRPALLFWTLLVVLSYGVLGFYFLQKRHFNMDFTFAGAIESTLNGFVLLNMHLPEPQTFFGRFFLHSLNFLGIGFLAVLFWRMTAPYAPSLHSLKKNTHRAEVLLDRYGISPVDYFKVDGDKHHFFCKQVEGFVAFSISSGFALVLEGPVCKHAPDQIRAVISEFECFCQTKGLRPVYYRVDACQNQMFKGLGKKSFHIGQEALVDVQAFSLEGKKRKSLRNAVNKLTREGYQPKIYKAPIPQEVMLQLEFISDCWLRDTRRQERGFSQGVFDPLKLKYHDIITLENRQGKVIAFLNIIPNYAPGEATYDLIRKLDGACGGNMDMLILKFIDYCKDLGYSRLNMGLAPFSGVTSHSAMSGKLLGVLYKVLPPIRAWQGIRDFKDKFDPSWHDKFLIYEHDYDLLLLPAALNSVMRTNARPAKRSF